MFLLQKDELENLDPPLSHAELQRRYEEIENNKDFGRTALGKNYDLSFKEYFEERTFVDPLDPTQGETPPKSPYLIFENGYHLPRISCCTKGLLGKRLHFDKELRICFLQST
jgi:hypothetical protein